MTTSGGVCRELPGEQVGAWKQKVSGELHGGGGEFELGHVGKPGFVQELLGRV